MVNTVQFLLDEPAIRLPANQPERLFHEIGHPLLSTTNNPVVEPFRQTLNHVLQAAMIYLDGECRAQERRRGPSRLLFTLECWARSWVSWSVEFLCDLFGAFMIGPAFAWSHLHLCAKRGGDPFGVPSFAPTSHPPDAARMSLVLKGLARCGFTADVARLQDRWRAFLALVESQAEPEYGRCFPDQLLDEICRAAWDGVVALGCRIASPSTNDEVYGLLNRAWDEFWRDPAGYGSWEQGAVATLFSSRSSP